MQTEMTVRFHKTGVNIFSFYINDLAAFVRFPDLDNLPILNENVFFYTFFGNCRKDSAVCEPVTHDFSPCMV